ncbi:MAG: plastocyanin/azurin family copper-binding protein [Longimicrobiales bacterium]
MQISQSKDRHHSSSRLAVALYLTFSAAGAVALLVSGGAASERATTPVTRAERTAAPVDTVITIHTTGSNLEFMPSRISAKQGTRVTIRYINEGTLPHNFVLVKDESDISTLGKAAFQAKDTGHIPLEFEDRMIAHSSLVVPGETAEITFEVPPAGEYFFVCLYPGHYNMMVGTLQSLK